MYNLTLYTKYGNIYLMVGDVLTYDVEELMHQPWVEGVSYRWIDRESEIDKRCKRLVKVKEGGNYGK